MPGRNQDKAPGGEEYPNVVAAIVCYRLFVACHGRHGAPPGSTPLSFFFFFFFVCWLGWLAEKAAQTHTHNSLSLSLFFFGATRNEWGWQDTHTHTRAHTHREHTRDQRQHQHQRLLVSKRQQRVWSAPSGWQKGYGPPKSLASPVHICKNTKTKTIRRERHCIVLP